MLWVARNEMEPGAGGRCSESGKTDQEEYVRSSKLRSAANACSVLGVRGVAIVVVTPNFASEPENVR